MLIDGTLLVADLTGDVVAAVLVVGTLDVNVWTHQPDGAFRGRPVADCGHVDRFHGGQHLGPQGRREDRPVGPLVDVDVLGDGDEEHVGLAPRGLDVADVAHVQEVEDPVAEGDREPLPAEALGEFREAVDGGDLVAGPRKSGTFGSLGHGRPLLCLMERAERGACGSGPTRSQPSPLGIFPRRSAGRSTPETEGAASSSPSRGAAARPGTSSSSITSIPGLGSSSIARIASHCSVGRTISTRQCATTGRPTCGSAEPPRRAGSARRTRPGTSRPGVELRRPATEQGSHRATTSCETGLLARVRSSPGALLSAGSARELLDDLAACVGIAVEDGDRVELHPGGLLLLETLDALLGRADEAGSLSNGIMTGIQPSAISAVIFTLLGLSVAR